MGDSYAFDRHSILQQLTKRPLTPEPVLKKKIRYYNPEFHEVAYDNLYSGDIRRALALNFQDTMYYLRISNSVRQLQRWWRRVLATLLNPIPDVD